MDALTWFASALAFAVAMSATPGPNNAMVTASGANFGFRATVPHMAGIAVGFPLMLFVVALGAGEVLRAWPWLDLVLRWIGAAYLVFLAWKIATARPAAKGSRIGQPLAFLQAALFQWVNPKAWVVAVDAVVTFTTGAAVLRQAGALAVIFLLVGMASSMLWALVGVGAARLLQTDAALRRFNQAMACLLVASLVPLLAGE